MNVFCAIAHDFWPISGESIAGNTMAGAAPSVEGTFSNGLRISYAQASVIGLMLHIIKQMLTKRVLLEVNSGSRSSQNF
jgi:hypothetical protein